MAEHTVHEHRFLRFRLQKQHTEPFQVPFPLHGTHVRVNGLAQEAERAQTRGVQEAPHGEPPREALGASSDSLRGAARGSPAGSPRD